MGIGDRKCSNRIHSAWGHELSEENTPVLFSGIPAKARKNFYAIGNKHQYRRSYICKRCRDRLNVDDPDIPDSSLDLDAGSENDNVTDVNVVKRVNVNVNVNNASDMSDVHDDDHGHDDHGATTTREIATGSTAAAGAAGMAGKLSL